MASASGVGVHTYAECAHHRGVEQPQPAARLHAPDRADARRVAGLLYGARPVAVWAVRGRARDEVEARQLLLQQWVGGVQRQQLRPQAHERRERRGAPAGRAAAAAVASARLGLAHRGQAVQVGVDGAADDLVRRRQSGQAAARRRGRGGGGRRQRARRRREDGGRVQRVQGVARPRRFATAYLGDEPAACWRRRHRDSRGGGAGAALGGVDASSGGRGRACIGTGTARRPDVVRVADQAAQRVEEARAGGGGVGAGAASAAVAAAAVGQRDQEAADRPAEVLNTRRRDADAAAASAAGGAALASWIATGRRCRSVVADTLAGAATGAAAVPTGKVRLSRRRTAAISCTAAATADGGSATAAASAGGVAQRAQHVGRVGHHQPQHRLPEPQHVALRGELRRTRGERRRARLELAKLLAAPLRVALVRGLQRQAAALRGRQRAAQRRRRQRRRLLGGGAIGGGSTSSSCAEWSRSIRCRCSSGGTVGVGAAASGALAVAATSGWRAAKGTSPAVHQGISLLQTELPPGTRHIGHGQSAACVGKNTDLLLGCFLSSVLLGLRAFMDLLAPSKH